MFLKRRQRGGDGIYFLILMFSKGHNGRDKMKGETRSKLRKIRILIAKWGNVSGGGYEGPGKLSMFFLEKSI